MRRAKVLLAHDRTIVAEGLKSLLKDHYDLVGTVTDGSQLVDAASPCGPTSS
jgi:DNA-binding NarL/FixJ family response regulator